MKHFTHLLYLILPFLTVFSGCEKEPVTDIQDTQQQVTPPPAPPAPSQDAKVLVVSFSFTGTTKSVATTLAELSGGTLYSIEPETPYGSENNTYYDQNTRAYQEQYGPASVRPAIKKTLDNAGDYDVILLGFPIWYGKAPRVIFTFLDAYPFKGKTVVPFITSGSTGISSAAAELKSAYAGITWKNGDRLNGKTREQLKSWLESSGIKVK